MFKTVLKTKIACESWDMDRYIFNKWEKINISEIIRAIIVFKAVLEMVK